MTPTDFEFIVTVSGDVRLVEIIRQLAVHAGAYATLPGPASERLAASVADATALALGEGRGPDGLTEVRFTGTEPALEVSICGTVAPQGHPPPSASSEGLSVAWQREGNQHTCVVRHQRSR